MKDNSKMGSSDSLLETIRTILEKEHTVPKTPKEKSLAKLAHPKDKITHKDVLVGRGVLKKENSGDRMGVIVGTRKEKVELDPKLKEEEQVDERKLTGAETAKKEKLVLSLKKKMGGFKKRYGERAKDVMYATATKMAKNEEVEQVEEARSLRKNVNYVGRPVVHKDGRTGVVQNSHTDGSHSIKWKGEKTPTKHDWFETKNKIRLEEVEQVDELSKQTMGSYIKKASHDVATKSAATGRYADRANAVKDQMKKGDYSNYMQGKKDDATADKMFKKSWKRRAGIAKATDKLTKD